MEPSNWSRVKDLFELARRLPPAEREVLLRTSGGDAGTLADVRSLLAFYDEAPEFLEDGP